MGIIGIGTDLIHISRISKIYSRYGERFLRKAYSPFEIQLFDEKYKLHKNKGEEYLASRWAIKEATYKVLHQSNIGWIPFYDIVTKYTPTGAISLELNNKAEEAAKELDVKRSHVSISHEIDMVVAFVILEN